MIWFWHVLFDGTPLCRCFHSQQYRATARARRERL